MLGNLYFRENIVWFSRLILLVIVYHTIYLVILLADKIRRLLYVHRCRSIMKLHEQTKNIKTFLSYDVIIALGVPRRFKGA